MGDGGHRKGLAERIAGLSPAKRGLMLRRLGRSARSGHEVLAEQLAALGISHVYTITGVPIDRALACCAERGIRVVGARDQRGAALAALGQNYQAGRLAAAVIVSAGPAVTNTATAIHSAAANCWPLLVIGGCAANNLRGMGEFQELDGAGLFASLCRFSARVPAVAELPAMIARAVAAATQGRPGPAYVDIPADVLAAQPDEALAPVALPAYAPPRAEREALRQAAALLRAARRPLLVVGKGLRWSEPFAELRALTDAIGLPFVCSPMGRGFLPDDHPLCLDALHADALAQADVVLLLGARLDWTFRFGAELAPDVRLVQIDIEPTEIGRNVAATVGIVADLGEALRAVLAELDGFRVGADVDAWIAQLQRRRDARKRALAAAAAGPESPLSPHALCAELAQVLPADAVCVLDGATILAAAQQLLPARTPLSRYTPGSNGCLGSGIPFAIGARLQSPQRLVVAVCGDLAAGFSLMEIETAVRYQLPLIVVIANNGGPFGLDKQRRYHARPHADPVAAFQSAIRYEQICSALGGHGEFVDGPGQFADAWRRARASGKPTCINVIVDPLAPYAGRD